MDFDEFDAVTLDGVTSVTGEDTDGVILDENVVNVNSW